MKHVNVACLFSKHFKTNKTAMSRIQNKERNVVISTQNNKKTKLENRQQKCHSLMSRLPVDCFGKDPRKPESLQGQIRLQQQTKAKLDFQSQALLSRVFGNPEINETRKPSNDIFGGFAECKNFLFTKFSGTSFVWDGQVI